MEGRKKALSLYNVIMETVQKLEPKVSTKQIEHVDGIFIVATNNAGGHTIAVGHINKQTILVELMRM